MQYFLALTRKILNRLGDFMITRERASVSARDTFFAMTTIIACLFGTGAAFFYTINGCNSGSGQINTYD